MTANVTNLQRQLVQRRLIWWKVITAWKVSVSRVFLFRIFPYLDRIFPGCNQEFFKVHFDKYFIYNAWKKENAGERERKKTQGNVKERKRRGKLRMFFSSILKTAVKNVTHTWTQLVHFFPQSQYKVIAFNNSSFKILIISYLNLLVSI